MRKLYPLAIMLCLSLSIKAQSNFNFSPRHESLRKNKHEIELKKIKNPDITQTSKISSLKLEQGNISNTQLKSAQTTIKVLDYIDIDTYDELSGQLVDYMKSEATEWDEYGNATTIVTSRYDSSTGLYDEESKNEYTYNSNGQLIMSAQYSYDEPSGNWVGNQKNEYTFDTQGRINGNIHYNWNSDAKNWVKSYFYEVAYDDNDNRIHDATYSWDSTLNDGAGNWKCEYRYIQEFNSYGNEVLYTYEYLDYNTNNLILEGSKRDYTYDANGKVLECIEYVWNNETNEWDNNYKTVYEYNTNGEETYGANFYWDSSLSTPGWVGNYKYEDTFDNNGNEVLYEEFSYSENEWYVTWRMESTYENSYPFATSTIYYNWDYDSNQLIQSEKEVLDSYSKNGNLEEAVIYSYEWSNLNSEWIPDSKYETTRTITPTETNYTEYDYDWDGTTATNAYYDIWTIDSNGNYILDEYYSWDGSSWIGDGKYESEYADNGELTLEISYQWDEGTNGWTFYSRSEYNDNGNITLSMSYNDDFDSDGIADSEMIPSNKEIFEYNAYNEETLYEDYDWDNTLKSWILKSKDIHEYDYTLSDESILEESYNWVYDENKLVGEYKAAKTFDSDNDISTASESNWDLTLSNWYITYLKTYYYKDLATDTKDFIDNTISLFPNPAKDYITINGLPNDYNASLIIYNASGQIVLQKTITENEKINIQSLPNGIYICEVESNGSSTINKLIIK